jgi:hypothetical protein
LKINVDLRGLGEGGQFTRPARYVDRKVAYALQIVIDLEYRDDESKVCRDRLVEREYFEALFLYFNFKEIDPIVSVDDLLG